MSPRVSVVIRSYNRLPALCELIEALLAQRHDSFEIVVVDQSTEKPAEAVERLAELERDPRVHVLRFPPLGGARARNVAVENSRGEVVVCIDDDDLPIGDTFLAEMERPFLEDPKCVGVTCRHYWKPNEQIGIFYRFYAWRRCMRFSPITKLAYTYPLYDRPIRGVHWVHGTGGAYRRSVFERFGGWDEDTPIEDESSLALRMMKGLDPDEYMTFDPRPGLQRRMGLAGGLAKRWMTPGRFYARFMTFVHHVMARYFPVRVRLLYPLYVLAGWRWTIAWLWDDSIAHDTFWKRLVGSLAFTLAMPWHLLKALPEPMGTPPGTGVAVRDRMRSHALDRAS